MDSHTCSHLSLHSSFLGQFQTFLNLPSDTWGTGLHQQEARKWGFSKLVPSQLLDNLPWWIPAVSWLLLRLSRWREVKWLTFCLWAGRWVSHVDSPDLGSHSQSLGAMALSSSSHVCRIHRLVTGKKQGDRRGHGGRWKASKRR